MIPLSPRFSVKSCYETTRIHLRDLSEPSRRHEKKFSDRPSVDTMQRWKIIPIRTLNLKNVIRFLLIFIVKQLPKNIDPHLHTNIWQKKKKMLKARRGNLFITKK